MRIIAAGMLAAMLAGCAQSKQPVAQKTSAGHDGGASCTEELVATSVRLTLDRAGNLLQ